MEKKKNIAKPLFTLSIIMMGVAGLGNLAISQVHINTITKVFASEIGFYFFLFIIFGLVCFMNALNMKKRTSNRGNAILMGIFGLLAVSMGYVYIRLLLADISLEKLLTYKDIAPALYITIVSCIVYGIGSILILATHKVAKKEV